MELKEDIRKAVDCMRSGGVILYPTDTVWGLGCDATNEEAVKKIFQMKRRADSKSMLILVDSVRMLERVVDELPDVAEQLIEAVVEPLTVIYDGATGIAPSLIAEDGSVGVRITGEEYSRSICKLLGRPVVSTSANFSGERTPSIFPEISEEIKEKADYIADYRRDDREKRKPSRIIKLGKGGEIKIIR